MTDPTKTKVLIVEDEAIVASDIESRLRKAGYSVPATAASGEQALEKIEETSPDLVLMDIRLQGKMDGIATATEIRNRFKLPVIYLTAHADRATLERAKVTGPFSYLVKPIGNVNLSSAIEVALYKHRAERQLQDREAWLSTVLQSVADAMVVTDAWGRVQFLNPMAEQLTGWAHKEASGRPLFDVVSLLDSADRTITSELLSAAILQAVGTELPRDVHLISRCGRAIEVEGQIAISQAANRAAVGTVMTFRDVTVRKREEGELRQEQEMLVAGRLAGGVALDFKQPLSVILDNSEELLREMEATNPRRDRIKAIHQAGHAAAALTAQLLELHRNQMVQPQNVDLNGVLDRLFPTLQRLAGPSINIETNLDPKLGKISADPSQMEQVLLRLVLNARDAMPEGGRVSIHTENVDLPPRAGLDNRPEPFVRLAVRDNGAGMDSHVAEHIFEPFFTTKEGKGTGLGLAIVHAIVTAGNGLINVDSKPGGGALFEIFFPRLEEPRAVPVTKHRAALQSDRASTVLLVDPQPEVRKLVHNCLQSGGYDLLEAEDSEEALIIASLHDGPIDLVVTDVSMASMEGPKLGMRLAEVRPQTKVLLMSDQAENFSPENVDVSLIRKPFTKEALLDRVKEILVEQVS
jgi:PAS domain S-box-containing protein